MTGMGDPPKVLVEGARAGASLGVKVARSLYGRWRSLGPAERERLAPLAEEAKERALEARGAGDARQAERDLAAANESLAAGIVESAEADPEVSETEVHRLRDDLRRELDRLATAEVKASRGTAEGAASREGTERGD
jgi:hypothetical protein